VLPFVVASYFYCNDEHDGFGNHADDNDIHIATNDNINKNRNNGNSNDINVNNNNGNYHHDYNYFHYSDHPDVDDCHHTCAFSTADILPDVVAHRPANGMPNSVRPSTTVQSCRRLPPHVHSHGCANEPNGSADSGAHRTADGVSQLLDAVRRPTAVRRRQLYRLVRVSGFYLDFLHDFQRAP
jgi:hypothetical protein